MLCLSRPLVLVVEDDRFVRGTLRTLLQTQYDVLEASNASEVAIALSHHRPDAITLDIGLPDLDGMEILEWIHSFAPHIPVVVITGYESLDITERAFDHCACAFITKPVNPAYLMTAVQEGIKTHSKGGAWPSAITSKMSAISFSGVRPVARVAC